MCFLGNIVRITILKNKKVKDITKQKPESFSLVPALPNCMIRTQVTKYL